MDGQIRFVKIEINCSKIGKSFGIIGLQFNGSFLFTDGLFQPSQFCQGNTQVKMDLRNTGL